MECQIFFFLVAVAQVCRVETSLGGTISCGNFKHAMPASDKLATLVQWFEENEVEWTKDLIEVKDTNGSLGVFAKKDIEEGVPGKIITKREKGAEANCRIHGTITQTIIFSCQDTKSEHTIKQNYRNC